MIDFNNTPGTARVELYKLAKKGNVPLRIVFASTTLFLHLHIVLSSLVTLFC